MASPLLTRSSPNRSKVVQIEVLGRIWGVRGAWILWVGKKTYNRTVVLLIFAFPFVSFLQRWFRGDHSGCRGRDFVVRSVPARHSSTDPEDEKAEREA